MIEINEQTTTKVEYPNIITMCAKCHYDYDFTGHRAKIKELVKSYLKSHYPDWSESELIYRKWNLE